MPMQLGARPQPGGQGDPAKYSSTEPSALMNGAGLVMPPVHDPVTLTGRKELLNARVHGPLGESATDTYAWSDAPLYFAGKAAHRK